MGRGHRFLEGSALPQPSFTPRTHLMGLSPSKGSCTPWSPGRSQHYQRLVGWEGLAGPSLHRVPPVPAPGAAGRTRPEPAPAPRGRSALCGVHFRLSRGSQAMRGGHRLCGQEAPPSPQPGHSGWSGPCSRVTHLGLASPVPFPVSLSHGGDWSTDLSAGPKLAGRGAEGRAEGQPPLICHRDTSNLFILVKKRTKTTLHCIWLDP